MAEKRKAAVALGYDTEKDSAPVVIAAGQGVLAEEMLRRANEHGIPIHVDHPLAQSLVKLQVGSAIPPELYAAVAEVLAFLWACDREGQGE